MTQPTKENSGPAFPMPIAGCNDGGFYLSCQVVEGGGGMDLRTLAALLLRVPDSGIPWIDEMIKRAQRRDVAAHMMGSGDYSRNSDAALKDADAFLYELEKKP